MWWDEILSRGPSFGYFPNPLKSWLVVKPELVSTAKSIFADVNINITSEGRCYLGSPIGSSQFVSTSIQSKISEWVSQLELLTTVATTQPHPAFAALIHGFTNKWSYYFRSTPGIDAFIGPLEECLRNKLLPTLTGQSSISDSMRSLLSLPPRLGGMGIVNLHHEASAQYSSSLFINSPLFSSIIRNTPVSIMDLLEEVSQRKNKVKADRLAAIRLLVSELSNTISDNLKRCLEAASEKGSSSWITALPIKDHGFALHKGAFRDAICLRYGWIPSHLPSTCICGAALSVDHALNCNTGGFPSLRYNDIRDITANLLTEICSDVSVEPPLQPLSGESLSYRTANVEAKARVDVAATDFWSFRQKSFFDVRVFNPFSSTYRNSSIMAGHKRHEKEKRRNYEERIRLVEHGSFTPLVFSTAGGIGPSASIFYKRLASQLSELHNKPYSQVLCLIRCQLSFSLLRSAIMCLRGARSSKHRPVRPDISSVDLALSEGRLIY